MAAWAFERGQAAGRFTDTLPDAHALYLPLQTSNHRLGVLGVHFEERDTWTLDDNDLLETFAAQIAVMIESYRRDRDGATGAHGRGIGTAASHAAGFGVA